MPGIAHFVQIDEYPLGDFDDIPKCKQHYGDALAGKIFSVRANVRQDTFSSMDVEKYVAASCAVVRWAESTESAQMKCGWKFATNGCCDPQPDMASAVPAGALEQTLYDVRRL